MCVPQVLWCYRVRILIHEPLNYCITSQLYCYITCIYKHAHLTTHFLHACTHACTYTHTHTYTLGHAHAAMHIMHKGMHTHVHTRTLHSKIFIFVVCFQSVIIIVLLVFLLNQHMYNSIPHHFYVFIVLIVNVSFL